MQFYELKQANILKKFAKKHLLKVRILAQFAYKTVCKFNLRWLLAISSIPLFGIYAAFGLAPQTITSNIPTSIITEQIALPLDKAINLQNNASFIYKEYVRGDDTLSSILSRLNIHQRDDIQFIRDHVLNSETSQKLKSGQSFQASIDQNGHLISLNFQYADDQSLQFTKSENEEFTVKPVAKPLEVRPILKSAVINSSLFASTDQANIPDSIAVQIVDILESEIDFHTDLRKGDTLNVIYEGSFDEGELVKTGNVLALEFVSGNNTHLAIGFSDENNEMEYYTPAGVNLHKSFLRSPLEFTRVTSGFSLGRFHPVLQRMRAHKGVDMAAPIGTGIKAAGDALVSFAGVKGGYGNVIILKHDNGVSTVYGHLSRFAAGLKAGKKITQGDIIGYVGMTGLATGPHLHYEFLLNGQHRDPMTVALPKAHAIPPSQKAIFAETSRHLMAQIQLLNNTNIAALE